MSKICILGDTHFCTRKGSKTFNDYFEKFYTNIFFPYLINNNIKTIIQIGDCFDERKSINIQGLSECKRYFFDKIVEYGLELLVLVGNHDSYHKNTISVNSPNLLLGEYNFRIIDKPITLEEPINATLLPWICDDNLEDSLNEITFGKSSVCLGHLELKGFAVNRGIIADDGMDPKLFDKFDLVISGHYHHRSSKDNILFTGVPYELTWHDHDDPKGFHIFDTNTRELQFIQNPYKMFHKVFYDDILNEEEIKQELDIKHFEQYADSYLKVIVKNKENPYLFDLFIDALYKVNPIDLVIIEDQHTVLEEELDSIDETEDTLTILSRYVDNVKVQDLDSNKLKLILGDLYNEASRIEAL